MILDVSWLINYLNRNYNFVHCFISLLNKFVLNNYTLKHVLKDS